MKLSNRIYLALALIILIMIARPVYHLTKTWLNDKDERLAIPNGFTDDASQLNLTGIDTILRIPADADSAKAQLRKIIIYANQKGKKIAIAGAQHSMGGHSITKDGVIIDMRGFNKMELDSTNNILTVGSGALWADIIPFLDKQRRSVIVMQSNNSFSVGGSISVNCHGWQVNSPPIESTVESFNLLEADGTIVNCSRVENPELFSLALGGYGLFGVILDVKLRVTENKCYSCERYIFASAEYLKWFDKQVNQNNKAEMAYGRLDIRPDNFLKEAILTVFSNVPGQPPPILTAPTLQGLKREVFRGSAGSDYGKEFRWNSEKTLGEFISGSYFSRNQLLNESADVYADHSAATTDILHEYFIPRNNATAFISDLQKIIPQHKVDLLNITIRNVLPDTTTFLHYTNGEMFAFVMLYSQPKTKEGESEMQLLTRELIDVAIKRNGDYYLPYRLHATKGQFNTCYPQALKFFELKRKYDPKEIFSNKFYEAYKN